MKILYDDSEVDALYLELSKEKPERVREISDGINLDVTENDKLVGIEILDASNKFNI